MSLENLMYKYKMCYVYCWLALHPQSITVGGHSEIPMLCLSVKCFMLFNSLIAKAIFILIWSSVRNSMLFMHAFLS